MVDEGYEVHVYADRWVEEDSRICFHQVKTIGFPKSLRLLSFAMRATREIENANYDITLGVGSTLKADILQPHGGVHWAWFWRSLRAYEHPVSWAIKLLGRVLSPKQWVSGWIEDTPYRHRNLPKIIAISDMVKEDMIRWYRIPADRITVVYNGVDIERFHPRNCQYREEIRKRHGIGEEILILFVSNNFRMKGLGHLIRALADLKRENINPFKLVVLGRDRKGPYLHLARRTGISGEVIFAGPSDEPEKYYGAADLLAHPTFYDACSLTVLEAIACGLPVITTSCNGASGMITHGKDGWVVAKPENGSELRMAIKSFFDRKGERQGFQCGGGKAEIFSEERNFGRVMGVFREAVRQG
jgi:UDP-glucose:(heptosyl)LPS alpha-1,3-glucosyltransferase